MTKREWNGILYDGGYDNYAVSSDVTSHSNQFTEQSKRAGIAYAIATAPETFDEYKKNNIKFFHGTNSNALPGILKYGMRSGARLTKEGVEVITGEQSTRSRGQRNFISFTDDLDTAIGYAGIAPSKQQDGLESFGVVIGISEDDIKNLRTRSVSSDDLVEIGIQDSIPLEYIKSISVPADKVEFVKKMSGNSSIPITSLDFDAKFYSFYGYQIETYDQRFQEQLEGMETKKSEKVFTNKEVNGLAMGRMLSKIREMYNKVKEKNQNKGRDNEYDARTE